jgi:phosphate transport system permease protein
LSQAAPPRQKLQRLRPVRQPSRARWLRREIRERTVQAILFLAGSSSVLITLAIIGVLFYESLGFFRHVSLIEFLTETRWTPQFANPKYGILPLVAGTLVTTAVALLVALPIATVVYGYFALQFVAPLLQAVIPGLPTFNMLSAGLVMGIMIIPYVSSLSEDAMRSVPMLLREGSYALGANKIGTGLGVVVPSALSGIGAAYILGISRAIGETMIVAIAAGMQPNFTFNPTEPAATITAYIVAVSLGDLPHGSIGYQSIFAAGFVLFCMTLFFNVIGHVLRRRFHQAY